MIKIRDNAGTATYYTDPYPQWLGDEVTIERADDLRLRAIKELVKQEPDVVDADDMTRRFHSVFLKALELVEDIEVVEAVEPPLDILPYPLAVR